MPLSPLWCPAPLSNPKLSLYLCVVGVVDLEGEFTIFHLTTTMQCSLLGRFVPLGEGALYFQQPPVVWMIRAGALYKSIWWAANEWVMLADDKPWCCYTQAPVSFPLNPAYIMRVSSSLVLPHHKLAGRWASSRQLSSMRCLSRGVARHWDLWSRRLI